MASRAPVKYLRASVTWMEAARLTAVLRMPAVSQVSTGPEGGLGKMQARQAVSAGQDVHGGGVGADGGGVDPGEALLDGVVVDEVAGLEVVGGVEDELGAGQQRVDVVRDEVGDVGVDLDIGVEAGDLAAGGLGFGGGGGGIGLVEEHLALQVALFDEIAVDEDEGADAGAGEQGGGSGAGGSAADDSDGGGGEALLAGFADGCEEHLTGVAVASSEAATVLALSIVSSIERRVTGPLDVGSLPASHPRAFSCE